MKVYIRTFGCQANFRDSEWMIGRFLASDWHITENPYNADLVIINTCSVRKHAEDRAFSFLGRLKKIKYQNAKFKIVLMGCTAEAYGKNLLNQFPYLDGIFGPSQEQELIDNIEQLFDGKTKLTGIGKQNGLKCFHPAIDYREKKISAFVSIMEGCNNFCSFCIVPYVRGRERSRPLQEIVDEVKALVDKGYKEILLLGQNVNSYQLDSLLVSQFVRRRKNGFIKLLEEVDKTGIERIRFMTSHPKDTGKDLFKAIMDLPHVCEHLHLPLQAGSDRILKLMNRNYTLRDYLRLIETYRKIVEDGSLTTDIIVGFPTETEEDFNKTIDALKKIQFDSAFIFKYSPRPFTQASKMKDDVPKKEKERRNLAALSLQREISFTKRMKLLDRNLEVLFEEKDKNGLNFGRSREGFTVHAQGSDIIGEIKRVKINTVKINSLIGEIIE